MRYVSAFSVPKFSLTPRAASHLSFQISFGVIVSLQEGFSLRGSSLLRN
jgi:hypothetical protein